MFITVEGPDGSGKTTALKNIKRLLTQKGYQVVITREPGGEKTAEKIRHVILDPESAKTHPWTEALLYLAARKEHMDKIVEPALRKGKIVISDRYLDSTLAYQGSGRGLDHGAIKKAHRLVLGDNYLPDLTIYFDISLGEQATRLGRRSEKTNRFDQADYEFKKRVRNGYREIARSEPQRFRIVDATKPLAAVREEVEKIIVTEVINHGSKKTVS